MKFAKSSYLAMLLELVRAHVVCSNPRGQYD